jgi:ATP-binding cassette subfamily F protein 2
MPIRKMSDGQKRRVVWTELWMLGPHMLLLDEPTNHLDMETIDALAEGIKKFEGGMLLVSHDFRLIDQVAKEVWVCDKKGVTTWQGDIRSYKESLREKKK